MAIVTSLSATALDRTFSVSSVALLEDQLSFVDVDHIFSLDISNA
jgi:hypothetical protein